MAHEQEGRLFKDLVKRAAEAGLLPKRTLQVMVRLDNAEPHRLPSALRGLDGAEETVCLVVKA